VSKLSTSLKIYFGLILIFAASNTIQVLLPAYKSMIPSTQTLPLPLPVIALANAGIAIVLYGGLGLIGLFLAKRLGFADIWSPDVNNRQRFLRPAVLGIAFGLFFIFADIIFARYNGVGRIIHPSFPTSIFASLSAGIGEELLFRLFFISFWVWLVSKVILRGRWQNQTFWVVTAFSALAFALGHLPSFLLLYNKSLSDISPVLYAEVILLNGIVSVFAAYYLRKYGYLAAIGIHFWTDIVWHVVWGLF
jgi:membrane protease YdiL (CAAX protease family)